MASTSIPALPVDNLNKTVPKTHIITYILFDQYTENNYNRTYNDNNKPE